MRFVVAGGRRGNAITLLNKIVKRHGKTWEAVARDELKQCHRHYWNQYTAAIAKKPKTAAASGADRSQKRTAKEKGAKADRNTVAPRFRVRGKQFQPNWSRYARPVCPAAGGRGARRRPAAALAAEGAALKKRPAAAAAPTSTEAEADAEADAEDSKTLAEATSPPAGFAPAPGPRAGSAAVSPRPVAADNLADWSVEKKLGRGSFGHVYRIKNRSSGERAAVKIIPRECSGSEVGKKEITVLKSLANQPHVLQMLHASRCLGHYRIITLLYDCTLDALVEARPLASNERIIAITAQLVEALSACQAAAVLRRDIKPANIFLTMEPLHAVLGDFGAARFMCDTLSELHVHTCYCTAGYCAPEILREEVYGFPSDVWSLGAALGEAASGASLFGALRYGTKREQLEHIYDSIVFCRLGHQHAQKRDWFCSGRVVYGQLEERAIPLRLTHCCSLDLKKLLGSMLKIDVAQRASPAALREKLRQTQVASVNVKREK